MVGPILHLSKPLGFSVLRDPEFCLVKLLDWFNLQGQYPNLDIEKGFECAQEYELEYFEALDLASDAFRNISPKYFSRSPLK